MAILHSSHIKLPKCQSFYAIHIVLFCIFSLTAQASIESTSFSFTSFTSDMHDINFEGDAYAAEPVVELTKNFENMSVSSIGRITYSNPIHIWDKATGHLADFSMHFSCVINSGGNFSRGDGITAFLVPTGSYIPTPRLSGGGYFGIYSDYMKSKLVAVELDTFWNDWDPKNTKDHIGIDINSVFSVKTVNWSLNNIENGGRVEVSIHYNSSSKNLSVSVTNGDYKTYADIHTYNLNLIVDLRDHLPERVTVGLSAATTTMAFEKNEIYSWDFVSILQVQSRGKGLPWLVWVAIGAAVLCSLLGALCGFFYWSPPTDRTGEFEEDSGPKKFRFKSLVVATNNFRNEIGRGGFGRVYEGLTRGTETKIAVKRITFRPSSFNFKDYKSEIKTIGQLRHRNLVQLKGWCREKQGWFCFKQEVLLLVYEFMEGKSLDLHLFNQSRLLTWDQRKRIVSGLATALRYMQEECDPYVVHRDIKSANVLLDSELNPKLGDFGQARLVEHEHAARTTDLIGTDGYMAPEYCQNRRPTKEADVYSFGMVVLEIACGKRAVFESQRNGRNSIVRLLVWAWEQYGARDNEETIRAIADPRLNGTYILEEMRRLIVVGLACAHPSHGDRPSIGEAIDMLEGKVQLPTLPSQMPLPPDIAALQATALETSGPPSQVGDALDGVHTTDFQTAESSEYNTAPSNDIP